jgi:hypothetical protein
MYSLQSYKPIDDMFYLCSAYHRRPWPQSWESGSGNVWLLQKGNNFAELLILMHSW